MDKATLQRYKDLYKEEMAAERRSDVIMSSLMVGVAALVIVGYGLEYFYG